MSLSLPLTLLSQRAVLTLTGPDRKTLLQGLITNDIGEVSPGTTLYAALLTPQGKYLHDFFLSEADNTLYLDCEKGRLPDLFRRLMMYRLRADVTIEDATAKYYIYASEKALPDAVTSTPDPRHSAMGYRSIMPVDSTQSSTQNDDHYDRLRLSYGLPDGSRDLDPDKTLILEGNMEELHGVRFTKGCYVGQEVTARMKHRANLKKRLLPVTVEGPLPERGTEIVNQDGKKVGDLRSGLDTQAIGYFRLADMTFDTPYRCGQAMITPHRPDWYPQEI